jgi:aquaporin Z
MEVGELGFYLLAACAFATLLQHPASALRQSISTELGRRALMGLGMGATVIALVTSRWGKRSGGHFNPAVTWAFYRLGKLEFWDAWLYVIAQFVGAISGVAVARVALRGVLADHAVRYAVTSPGRYGSTVAFVAELVISFILMITVLFATNRKTLAPYTAYLVGALIAIYFTFEAPLSGMSTNPARTFGSALHADYWHAVWIYFIAPSLGMLAAAEVFLRARGGAAPFCAKLHHANNERCIFRHAQEGAGVAPAVVAGSEGDVAQHSCALHSAVEGAHRVRSWLRTITRGNVHRRSRQIKPAKSEPMAQKGKVA